MNNQSGANILKQLRSDSKLDRQKAMLYFYETMYDKVKYYVQKNSGTPSEVDDVFQDSLIALYKQTRDGKLGDDVRIEAYLFTICKNHWLKELQKKKRTVELTEKHEKVSGEESQEAILLTQERSNLIEKLTGQVGATCYKVLRMYYYEKRRMKEIAKLLTLSNEQAAKDKKASCMKKLRALVKNNPHFLELLK